MRQLILLGLALLLTACAAVPRRPVVAPADPATRESLLRSLEGFRLEGRLAAAVGQEGYTANLIWWQQGARSDVELRAALGFGTAHLQREGGTVRLETSRGERFTGPEADADLAGQLGFRPPLDSLRYWMLGVADPARPAVGSAGTDGLPARLEQDGWQVDFTEYRALVRDGVALMLPRRLTLVRDTVRLRLLIDQWKLGAR